MARFFDNVGFAPNATIVDGVWSGNITERAYKGDILEETRSIEPGEKVEDDIRVQHRIRIIGDAFAIENFPNIRYVLWRGVRWVVNSATLERPEITMSLGGVYQGDTPD